MTGSSDEYEDGSEDLDEKGSNSGLDDANLTTADENAASSGIGESSQAAKPRRKRAPTTRTKLNTLNRHLSNEYRDLLNSAIREANGASSTEDHEPLMASQIAGSNWTSAEKQCFFTALPTSGRGGLRALARAVGTKSEVEVKAYVLLLQEGARESEASLRLEERFSLADVPAACEVGGECVGLEQRAAEALGKFIERAGGDGEAEEWGKWAVVREEEAEELDELYEAGLQTQHRADGAAPVKSDNDLTNEDDKKASPEPEDTSKAEITPGLPVQTAALLKPSAFLHLSRTLFMNSATDPEANWTNLTDAHCELAAPSLHRTALEDFHTLALSLTRRLVQATIFQSLSRLRACSDERVVPSVHAGDVEAAGDVLGMRADRVGYWAGAARRCGVDVYTEARKFADGRKTEKNGVKLTWEEVEQELELERVGGDDEDAVVGEADVDELEGDSDAFTEASASQDKAEDTEREEARRGRPSKRKRALSSTSFDRAENRYLERLDRLASQKEENRLRENLGLDQLPTEDDQQPEMRFRRATLEPNPRPWRDGVLYQAPWEVHGVIGEEEFEAMEREGRRVRKQRKMVKEAMLERMGEAALKGDQGESGEDDDMDGGGLESEEDLECEENDSVASQ